MADQASGLLSPLLRRARLRQALPHLKGRVLDFGCGVGALAAWCRPVGYVGVDRDDATLTLARRRWPEYRFAASIPAGARFDTIVALAVIEHVGDPAGLLAQFGRHLSSGGRIVLTTPHPAWASLHHCGAHLVLFSRDAAEEHQSMLDRGGLMAVAAAAGLVMVEYRRFLLGVNQLAIVEWAA